MTPQYFEDIPLGETRELGRYTFTAEDIIAFAAQFDPQPFHVDPEAARRSHFGGLVASGWHTAAIWMKLMNESRFGRGAEGDGQPRMGGGSPGFRDLAWPAPVRPGDTVTFTATPINKVPLKSRPEWGIIENRNEGVNQRGETVLRFIGKGMIARRPRD